MSVEIEEYVCDCCCKRIVDDYDPDLEPGPDGWLCEKCADGAKNQHILTAIEAELEAAGWWLDGCSAKSEAVYYKNHDYAPRIRVARHDSPYRDSYECIFIGYGSDCNCGYHAFATDETEAAEAVADAIEICAKHTFTCSECGSVYEYAEDAEDCC